MSWRRGVGLLALCLWSSLSWVWVDLLPDPLRPVLGQGLRYCALGVLSLLCAILWRGRVPAPSFGVGWRIVVGGAGLLGLSFVLVGAGAGPVSSSLAVLAFASLPLVMVPVAGVLGVDRPGMEALPAGLAGLAGLMLLVPFEVPRTVWAALGLGWMAGAVVVSAGCLVLLHRWLAGVSFAWAVGLLCLPAGVLLVVAGLLSGGASAWSLGALRAEGLRLGAVDVPEVLLLVWLVKVLAPQRLAARYFAAPLLTIIQGYWMVRPAVDFRTLAGVGLVGWGVWRLMWREVEDEGAVLRLGLGVDRATAGSQRESQEERQKAKTRKAKPGAVAARRGGLLR